MAAVKFVPEVAELPGLLWTEVHRAWSALPSQYDFLSRSSSAIRRKQATLLKAQGVYAVLSFATNILKGIFTSYTTVCTLLPWTHNPIQTLVSLSSSMYSVERLSWLHHAHVLCE
jgi:hypothetical protein